MRAVDAGPCRGGADSGRCRRGDGNRETEAEMRLMRALTHPSSGEGGTRTWLAPLLVAAIAATALAAILSTVPRGPSTAALPTAPSRRPALHPATLPPSALGVVSSAIGADGSLYRVSRAGSGLAARNPAQGLRVRFRSAGVELGQRQHPPEPGTRRRRLRLRPAPGPRGRARRSRQRRQLRARRPRGVVSQRAPRARAGVHAHPSARRRGERPADDRDPAVRECARGAERRRGDALARRRTDAALW